MTTLVHEFFDQALELASQYDNGDVNFADLTGLSEEFAASFAERLTEQAESERAGVTAKLEEVLLSAISSPNEPDKVKEALKELQTSLNRTPIY